MSGGGERARRPRFILLVLIGILLIAGVFRSIGIHRGNPEQQVDEPIMVEASGALLEGMRPDVVLGWPGGPQLLILAGLFSGDLLATRGGELLGGSSEPLDVLDEHYGQFYREPGRWYLMDRTVSVLFGLASVFLVWVLARRHLGGWIAGGSAAALMTVNVLHVEYSHYVLPDVPMTFFFLLSVLLLLNHVERPRIGALAASAFAAGLAAATKFNAAPLLIYLGVAAVLVRWEGGPSRMRRVLAVVVFGMAGLVIGCPWLLTDLPLVLKDFLWRNVYQQAIEGRAGAGSEGGGWLHVARAVLSLEHGVAFGVALIPAVLFGLFGRSRGCRWCSGLLLFYLFALGFSTNLSGRWLLPALPLVSVLAGGLIAWCLGSGRLRQAALRGAVLAVGACLLGASIWQTVQFDGRLLRAGPREVAEGWVRGHVRQGETIAVEYFAENPFLLNRKGLERRMTEIRETLEHPEVSRPDVPVFLYPAVLNEERFELQRARHLLRGATEEGYEVLQFGSADRYGRFLRAAKDGEAGVFILKAKSAFRVDRGKGEAELAADRAALVEWLSRNAAWCERPGGESGGYVVYGLNRESLTTDPQ